MERFIYLIYRGLTLLLRPLPVSLVFRIGSAIGLSIYFLARPYRRLVLSNMRIAFGDEKTAQERRCMARQHFANLGGNLLSALKIATIPPAEIPNIVTVEGMEHMKPLFAEKRPIVILIGHIGNWELLSQGLPSLFEPPTGVVYQRLGNRYIDADIRASRARLGLRLFERKEGFQAVIDWLREGKVGGVLVDQHAGDAGVWCPFFGRLASTTSLPATLSLRTGAALVAVAVYTERPGKWKIVVRPPLATTEQDAGVLTADINAVMEAQIREQPADWFWVHNRWKTPQPKFLLTTYKRGIAYPSGTAQPPVLKPFRILIRSTNWLGDAVMTIPAVRAIKAGRPDAHITILVKAKIAGLWRTVPEVDEVMEIEPRDGIFRVASRLEDRFDVAVLFPNSLHVALEARLAGIPRIVGYPGHRPAWLLNQVFIPKRKKNAPLVKPQHQVNHYLSLARFIGADDPLPDVSPKRAPRGPIARIAVCPGAEYGPAKRWPAERFAAAMTKISETTACEWVLLGVKGDAPIGADILRAFSGEVRNMIGETTLAGLMQELMEVDLLLTNDTGTMHLAAHLGVPVVAIFGSTEQALTGPLGSQHRVVRRHVPCSPCFLRTCPLDFRCMTRISPDEVATAVLKTLSPSAATTAMAGAET